MQSVQIARRIPHAIHYCDPFSTHASILESPEWCIAEIDCFITQIENEKQEIFNRNISKKPDLKEE